MLSMMERISRIIVSYFWWFAVFLKFHQFMKLPGRFRGRTKCLQISTTAQPWHGGWWWSAVTLHKRWLRGKHRRVAGRQAHFASHTRAMIPLSISHVMHLLTMHQLPLHANPHPALQPGRAQPLGTHHHEFAALSVPARSSHVSALYVSVRPQIFSSKPHMWIADYLKIANLSFEHFAM